MKKYLVGSAVFLFLVGLLLAPSLSFAQADPDPNTSASNCTTLVNNLRYRDRDINKNGEVSTLQDFLQSGNYLNSEPTGYFGLMTQKAVAAFQTANGIIPASGYVGPVTKAKIKALTCDSTTTTTPSTSISPTPVTTPVVSYVSCAAGQNYNSGTGQICSNPVNPIVTVLSPKGGEVLKQGDILTFSWNAKGLTPQNNSVATDVYKVRADNYYISAFPAFHGPSCYNDTIGEAVTEEGTCKIQIPSDVEDGQYIALVRVTNMSFQNFMDISEPFTISTTGTGTNDGCLSGHNYSSTTGQVCPKNASPVVTVSASPTSVTAGQSTIVTWSATNNPTSCYLTGAGGVSASGSKIVYPTATTTYTVTCTNASGSGSNSSTVTIGAVATPSIHISATSGSKTSDSSISVNTGDTFIISGVPQNLQGLTSYLGSGTPSSGTYSRAFVFDQKFSDSALCSNDSWSIKCSTNSSVLGLSNFYIEIYVNGRTYKSNSITVNVGVTTVFTPVVTVTASPSSIVSGGSTTINWSATNSPSYCTLSGGGVNSTNGATYSYTATPSVTTTYTIKCTNTSGSGSASTTVTVSSIPLSVVTVTASPSSITAGGSSTITYSATNSPSYCTLSGGGVNSTSGATGSRVVSPTTTTTYTASCTNAGGTSTGSATVSVSTVPVVTVTASPSSVLSGGSTTINWSATGSPSYCMGTDMGTNGASGSNTVYPMVTKTYAVDCYTSTGVKGSGSVTVTVSLIPLSVVTVTASPSSITAGGSSTITYSATNSPSYCTLSGGGVNSTSGATGSRVVSPTTTTTYTASCTNAGGTSTGSATVNVTSNTAPQGFTLSASPISRTSTGDSTQFDPITISVNRTGGFTGAVSLSFSNPGVNFEANTTFPASIPAGQSSVQFIAWPEGVANGTYHFDITGTNGSLSSTTTVYLTMASPLSWLNKQSLMANAIGAVAEEKNNGETSFITNISSCSITMTLSKGMNNDEVKCLQKKLNEKGFTIEGIKAGEETTLFGYNTMMAVKKFQSSKSLLVDGIFGLSSREALNK